MLTKYPKENVGAMRIDEQTRPFRGKRSADDKRSAIRDAQRDRFILRRLGPVGCFSAKPFTLAKLMNRAMKLPDYADVHSQISALMNFHRIRREGRTMKRGIYGNSSVHYPFDAYAS